MKIFRLILLILHVGILFLLLGSLLNAYIPPKIFPWFNLLSLGFPVLIVLYIVLTVFWVLSWKKRAFVFMFIGLAFINPVKRWVNFSSEKKESSSDIKIVSFNIKAGLMGKDEVQNYLKAQDADVILLQEDGGMEYPMLKGYNRTKSNGILTILTKHNLSNEKLFFSEDESMELQSALQADIEIKGKTYRFVDIYLYPFQFEKKMIKLDGNSEANEQKVKGVVKKLIPTFKIHQDQVKKIRESLENSPYPVIVAGDFNSVPNSYEYYHLSEDLEDAFMSTGKGSATSFHDYKFPIRIDYVFSSKSLEAVSYDVDRSVSISDHYPVITKFSLKDK
ncbi:AP endonuclease [Chryseobacterium contaminans]|uniref:AP endonuclease n=1 Tax=Chryseobacterium contaminans TaxID=1423959 RepID=A0A1M6V5U4_9FLAO|nr:endonuclease/exonuclease/phosphatase family protein [Chryseobacterium contaminans]OCA78950.1 AP endonuclease [Chryseobacterium contaminans]SHK76820.1 Metal-dependent hydrolase, endonuclease/exonuclease/phosphatase family [Chryseobacterium contaminans]